MCEVRIERADSTSDLGGFTPRHIEASPPQKIRRNPFIGRIPS